MSKAGYVNELDKLVMGRGPSGWMVRDLASKNGTRGDGARLSEVRLDPGLELGVGSLTLLAKNRRFIELRPIAWHARRQENKSLFVSACFSRPATGCMRMSHAP